jgi:hypothetical protein
MGYVFVFDLDQTLAGKYVPPPYASIDLNEDLVRNQLYRIHRGRTSGVTDAIFLYTNNSDHDYAEAVEQKIQEIIPGFYFDYIMSAFDPLRMHTGRMSPKLMEDVDTMMLHQGLSVENLLERIVFFDDNNTHALIFQMRHAEKNSSRAYPRQFIWINPPYGIGKQGKPDYSFIDELFPAVTATAPRLINNTKNNSSVGGRRTYRKKRRGHKKWTVRRLRKPGPKRSQNAL